MRSTFLASLVALLSLTTATAALAEPVDSMSVQGYLADLSGIPLDGDVDLVANLYSDAAGTNAVHTQTLVVPVDQGFFTAMLTAIDLDIFRDHPELYLGLAVDSDPEMDLLPITTTPWAGAASHAMAADDAATLGGTPPGDFRLAADPIDWSDLIGTPQLIGDIVCPDGGSLAFETGSSSWICSSPSGEIDPVFAASDVAGVTLLDIDSWDQAYGWGDHAAAGYLSTESDPAFTSSAAAGISTGDVADWTTAYGWGDHATAGYLSSYAETDPAFTSSTAAGISSTEVGYWNTAYGWGDHASAGYLSSYAETDPAFTSSAAAGISSTDVGNWNTAYGWDDHAVAGYIDSVTAGTGLTGGATSGAATLDVDTATIQARVTGTCPEGSSIRVISDTGGVTCQADAGGGQSYLSVPAVTCVAMETAPSPDMCGGGGTTRTEGGGSSFPCGLQVSGTALNTFVCPLDLPHGATLEEVTVFGADYTTAGYFEAGVYRQSNTTFAPNYISGTYAGNWQGSGSGFSGGSTNVTVFGASDSHVVDNVNYRYQVALGLKPSGGTVLVYSVRATYTMN